MQVKSIAEYSNSAILSTFIKLPFVIKIFVLSIFERPFYTGFTVYSVCSNQSAHLYSPSSLSFLTEKMLLPIEVSDLTVRMQG